MANYSQFLDNCSSQGVDLRKINFTFCGTGAVCSLISLVIILLIVFCKAYYSVLQRLFLYLMVAVVLRELFIAASFEHQFQYDVQEEVCAAIGFIWNWTGILVFMFTVGMKVYLFLYVKRLARGDTGPVFIQSRRGRVVLESLYVVLSVVLTLCYASVPFITGNYGLAGAWCWIRALNEVNGSCVVDHTGMIHQILNGYVFYVFGSVIGLVLLIATVVVYCRLPITRSNEAKLLLKKTSCVITTFLVNIIIMSFAFMVRVTAVKDRRYAHPGFWYSFGITFPTSLLLFPIVYMCCFFRVNRVSSCLTFCKRNGNTNRSIQNPTIPKSSRLSAPSSTYFDVPYTDDFTDISAHEALVVEGRSRRDTGYGSIVDDNSLKVIKHHT